MFFYSLADNYEQITKTAHSNMDQYLGHPVNQYRLVKRLASEWTEMEDLVTEDLTSSMLLHFKNLVFVVHIYSSLDCFNVVKSYYNMVYWCSDLFV